MQSIKFKELVAEIAVPSVILLCASPNSGKTYLTKQLIYHLKHKFHHGWVFSGTLFNGAYDFMPEQFCSDVYTDDKLQKILKYQSSHLSEPAFLVIDDMNGLIDYKKSLIKSLFSTYRHYNLTLFIATQYINDIPPNLRSMCRYGVVFKQTDVNSYRAAYKTFFSEMSYNAATQFIINNTADKSFILVENTAADKYKISRAPPVLKKFKFTFDTDTEPQSHSKSSRAKRKKS